MHAYAQKALLIKRKQAVKHLNVNLVLKECYNNYMLMCDDEFMSLLNIGHLTEWHL